MECRQNEVTGEGCLDTGGSRLMIPHLTDHDHIGVRPQKRPHHPGKIEADFRFALHLAQAFLADFHRVLGGPDFNARFVDVSHGRMKGGGFSGTGGTDNENQAIGLGDDIF